MSTTFTLADARSFACRVYITTCAKDLAYALAEATELADRCCRKARKLSRVQFEGFGCPEGICPGCYDNKPHDERHCRNCRCAPEYETDWLCCKESPAPSVGITDEDSWIQAHIDRYVLSVDNDTF